MANFVIEAINQFEALISMAETDKEHILQAIKV